MRKIFLMLLLTCFGTMAFGQTISREPEIKYDEHELLLVLVKINSLLEDKYYRIAAGLKEDWPHTDTIEEKKLATMIANYDNELNADGIAVTHVYNEELDTDPTDLCHISEINIYLNNSDGSPQWFGAFIMLYEYLFLRNQIIDFLKDYLYNSPTADFEGLLYFTEDGTYVPRSMINFH